MTGNGIGGTQEGARRRFGTVSNPGVTGRFPTYREENAGSLGQQDPGLGPGQSTTAAVSSQVRASIWCHFCVTFTGIDRSGCCDRLNVPDDVFRTSCSFYSRISYDRFVSEIGLHQLHPRDYFQVHPAQQGAKRPSRIYCSLHSSLHSTPIRAMDRHST